MKILRIVYDWPLPWDGLAPGPYFLTKAQGALGHNVIVLNGRLNGSDFIRLKFFERPEKNVLVIKLPRAISNHLGPFFSTSPIAFGIYLLLRLLNQVDIVHGHGHIMLFFNLYKYMFGWIDKVHYVAHFHNCSKARTINADKRHEKIGFVQRFIEIPLHELSDRLAVKTADALIVVSSGNKDEFIKYYQASNKKTYIVENGVPTHIFYPEKNLQLGFNKEILGVGVISPRKGVDILIESLKYLSDEYCLRWIGRCTDNSYYEDLAKLSKNINVHDRVRFEGYIPNLDIASFFKNASIFVLPSSYEGLPKVVLEALACGTKVLTSGFSLSVHIDGLYFLESLAPKQVAKQIKEVTESKISVDVQKVQSLFSWNTKAKEIDEIYKKIS